MSFLPLGARVLVKREEAQTATSTGIIIPDSADKEKPQIGEVVEVSVEVKTIAKGDKAVFGKYSGTEITLNGEDFIVLEVKDILGLVK